MLAFDPIARRTGSSVLAAGLVAVAGCWALLGPGQGAAAFAGAALAWLNWRMVAALVRWGAASPARRAPLAVVGFYAKGALVVALAAWLGFGLRLPPAGLLAGLSSFVVGALLGALRSVDSMRGPVAAEG